MAIFTYGCSDRDSSIGCVIRVDTHVLTTELAHEINSFWCNSAEMLASCDGDVILAVVKLAAAVFMNKAMEDGDRSVNWLNLDAFVDLEGWPPMDKLGIKLESIDGIPSPTAEDITAELLGGPKS